MAILLSKSLRSHPGTRWEPPVDIYRTPQGWTVKVELAGVDPNDVAIESSGSLLRIRGIRRDWIVREGWRHHSMEISYCHFERDIQLPAGVSGFFISSEYNQGMLLIHVATEGGNV